MSRNILMILCPLNILIRYHNLRMSKLATAAAIVAQFFRYHNLRMSKLATAAAIGCFSLQEAGEYIIRDTLIAEIFEEQVDIWQ
jgi:hypothetical protein